MATFHRLPAICSSNIVATEDLAIMKFRLVYRGDIPPASRANRRRNTDCKHEIRKEFHIQLKNFTNSDKVSDLVRRIQPKRLKNYKFVPIVGKKNHCSLDILFLRSDIPGSPGFAGDIDNRVKTLLDALTTPSTKQEIPSEASPEQHEDPFFCLLEDDNLVSQLSVEMDQLFDLPSNSESISSDALLIVTVNLEPGLLTEDGHLFL